MLRDNASSQQDYESAELDLAITRAGFKKLEASFGKAKIDVDKSKLNLSYT